MKKILITGANSYVGTSFEKWLSQWQDEYHVDTIDMIDGTWREKSFAGYDVVFHVAGIAHVSADPSKKDLYYRINRDLVVDTAKKAKNDGVKQFIFMSSMIIYGDHECVSLNTHPCPKDFYGDSKLQAEIGIKQIANENFKIVVLRPPMIYGKNSRGNYRLLSQFAKTSPLFVKHDNLRSMLYIENLCSFVKLMIDNEESGVFFPQNTEYVSTYKLVSAIAAAAGHKIWITSLLVPFITLGMLIPGKCGYTFKKVFGNSYYEMSMSEYKEQYRIFSFKESIAKSEGII